jgi:hypothetical protein
MVKMVVYGLVSASLVLVSACTIRTGDMTLLTTRNVASLNAIEKGVYEGEDCSSIPNLKEAIDRAIEKGGGNAMTDVALYLDSAPFHTCFRAKGKVVTIKP